VRAVPAVALVRAHAPCKVPLAPPAAGHATVTAHRAAAPAPLAAHRCCRHCQEQQLTTRQTRAALGVVAGIVRTDVTHAGPWGREQSWEAAQCQLLAVSVEQPPVSSGILTPAQAVSMADLLLQRYSPHWALYRQALGADPAAGSQRGSSDAGGAHTNSSSDTATAGTLATAASTAVALGIQAPIPAPPLVWAVAVS
jgi:hypothetical protein